MVIIEPWVLFPQHAECYDQPLAGHMFLFAGLMGTWYTFREYIGTAKKSQT